MKETEPSISTNTKNQLIEYLAAVSIGLVILAGGAAYFFYDKWKNAEDKVAAMTMQNTVLGNNTNAFNYNLEKTLKQSDERLAILLDPKTIRIDLNGIPAASKATLFWNKDSSEVYIFAKDLPPPPDGKQYQLWALNKKIVIDAGVFEVSDQLQKMKNIDKVDGFKITLEKKGEGVVP